MVGAKNGDLVAGQLATALNKSVEDKIIADPMQEMIGGSWCLWTFNLQIDLKSCMPLPLHWLK